jgi:hypothetical protein
MKMALSDNTVEAPMFGTNAELGAKATAEVVQTAASRAEKDFMLLWAVGKIQFVNDDIKVGKMWTGSTVGPAKTTKRGCRFWFLYVVSSDELVR